MQNSMVVSILPVLKCFYLNFAEVIECLLMFLLHELLDLTDELDVLYRSFVIRSTLNTSPSLYLL